MVVGACGLDRRLLWPVVFGLSASFLFLLVGVGIDHHLGLLLNVGLLWLVACFLFIILHASLPNTQARGFSGVSALALRVLRFVVVFLAGPLGFLELLAHLSRPRKLA